MLLLTDGQYYVPWKLTKAQEATLTEQKRNAEGLVAREKADFARQKVERLKELGVRVSEHEPSNATNKQARLESSPNVDPPSMAGGRSSVSVPKVDGAADVERRSSKAGHEKEHEDPGYVMVEAEEDTVIY